PCRLLRQQRKPQRKERSTIERCDSEKSSGLLQTCRGNLPPASKFSPECGARRPGRFVAGEVTVDSEKLLYLRVIHGARSAFRSSRAGVLPRFPARYRAAACPAFRSPPCICVSWRSAAGADRSGHGNATRGGRLRQAAPGGSPWCKGSWSRRDCRSAWSCV